MTAGIAGQTYQTISEYRYGKFQKDDVATFIPAVGNQVILPDLQHDLFDGITVEVTELEEKYGAFVEFVLDSEMPDLNEFEVLIDKWSISQLQEKEN